MVSCDLGVARYNVTDGYGGYTKWSCVQAEGDVLKQLESLLEQFFSPSSTNDQKSEISESSQ